MESEIMIEVIKERGPHGTVRTSDLREPLPGELEEMKQEGCNHLDGDKQAITDESGWLYDYRRCAICGKGLGVV